MSQKVVAIVGSYRKGETIDQAVEAILEGARAKGAVTQTVQLRNCHIEFCTNCRHCMQEFGESRGKCLQHDDLEPILAGIESADAVVLGAPVNVFNTTALFRRFMERLVGYGYWPWGQNAPKMRSKLRPRKAVLVTSAAMPGFLIPLATGSPRALRTAAALLGAHPVGKLWIGFSAHEEHQTLRPRTRLRARRLGAKLVSGKQSPPAQF
ncbi:MAG TPA: flavodoxin family protein [Terracidiphilus sp.]|jgi:putative NADPH-quinone reductase|nr:flavodoxin family protein [Terracidiphilus sp.]